MGKAIAVQGCVLDCPFAQITTPPQATVKCGGAPAYAGTLTIVISGYSLNGMSGGAGVGTLTGSAVKTTIGHQPAVLEGDKTLAPIMVTGMVGNSSATIPVTVTISSAGQVKVQGS